MLFLLSVPAQLKSSLLSAARLLIYTPSNEHFGIVPLEAMLAGVPVLAANSGGPLETVSEPATGWLRSPDKVDQWTDVLRQVLHHLPETQLQQMGANGKRRVREEFSETKMAQAFDQEFESMVAARRVEAAELGDVVISMCIIGMCILAIAAVIIAAATTEEVHLLEICLGTAVISLASLGIIAVIYKLLQNESAYR